MIQDLCFSLYAGRQSAFDVQSCRHNVTGFIHGLVEDQIEEFGWMNVAGWGSQGGSQLGTSRKVPAGADLYAIARALEIHKIEGLLDVLRPFGIIEMVRTGSVAMTRGAEAPSVDPHFVHATVSGVDSGQPDQQETGGQGGTDVL